MSELVINFYEHDSTVFPSIAVYKQICSPLFQEQMKPKKLLYSTGNGDCRQVGWSPHKADFLNKVDVLHGTDDDWLPSKDDNVI